MIIISTILKEEIYEIAGKFELKVNYKEKRVIISNVEKDNKDINVFCISFENYPIFIKGLKELEKESWF